MSTTNTEDIALGDLADQAAHAIRLLNHRTRLGIGGPVDPADAAEIIAALATMTARLPQLLGQLAGWLEHEHHHSRLRVDDLTPQPDTAQTVHAVSNSLQHATRCLQRVAAELDTAHQHAAHLASARSQDSCRSVGPDHLTKHTLGQASVGRTRCTR